MRQSMTVGVDVGCTHPDTLIQGLLDYTHVVKHLERAGLYRDSLGHARRRRVLVHDMNGNAMTGELRGHDQPRGTGPHHQDFGAIARQVSHFASCVIVDTPDISLTLPYAQSLSATQVEAHHQPSEVLWSNE